MDLVLEDGCFYNIVSNLYGKIEIIRPDILRILNVITGFDRKIILHPYPVNAKLKIGPFADPDKTAQVAAPTVGGKVNIGEGRGGLKPCVNHRTATDAQVKILSLHRG